MIPSGSSGLMGTKSKWVKKKMGVEESVSLDVSFMEFDHKRE